MVTAPVGFQCRSCVAEHQRATRRTRTLLAGPTTSRPTVTYTLIGICVAAFLWQLAAGVNNVAYGWGMAGWAIASGEWWRLLTSAFLHGSVLHLAFNMYILFVLGRDLERLLGHARYLALYLLSALGGAVASYWLSNPAGVSVGASGAVFGLLGATVIAGRYLRADVTQALILIGLNVVIGFIIPGIDWRAHLGGLVTGALVAFILTRTARRAPPARDTVAGSALAALAVVLVLAALLRTAALLS
ncbi:MAG: rhomboid family intramembrane serine protease [Actinomycetales bacterium]|nr:rhomboid family intramembrane serine protease [Actinomycetales bacterium]